MQDSSQSYSSDLWRAKPKEFDSFHTALTWINTPSSFPQLDSWKRQVSESKLEKIEMNGKMNTEQFDLYLSIECIPLLKNKSLAI